MSETDDIHRANPDVAEAGQRPSEGLLAENQRLRAELKAQRDAGMLVLRIDPKRVRATEYINRDERAFLDDDPKFKELKDSLRANGQEQPIRVRAVTDDPTVDFEIVSGHRRHRAALALDSELEGGFPILALPDGKASESRDLVLKMYRENEERADLSAFEKGAMFQQWLTTGVFAEQGELAAAIGVSDATVTKYLQIAELPPSVVAAFTDPRDIAVRWSHDLVKALKTNPTKVEEVAQRLANTDPRPDASTVARTLIASGEEPRKSRSSPSREKEIKIGGRVALRARRSEGRFTLNFFQIDKGAQREIIGEILELAERRVRERLKGNTTTPTAAAEVAGNAEAAQSVQQRAVEQYKKLSGQAPAPDAQANASASGHEM